LRAASPAAADRSRLTDAARRDFLRRSGLVGVAALVFAVGGRYIGRTRRGVEEARARLRLPVTRGQVPSGAEVGVDGLLPWRIPGSQFYRIDTAVVVPAVAASTWRLRIHGLVDKEVTLTYQQLLDRQITEAWVTLCCVSNPVGGDLVGNAWWSGVRIADLLKEAGPQHGADAVLQTSQDGWTCGTPLSALTDGRDAMLAIAMNGAPLPLEHGFPVRMVVPGLYGFVSATKWVVDLELTRFADFTAFWTERGWSSHGPVKTESRIDVPRSNHRVTAGAVRVGGVAWAQHTGIERVEVRLDGGPWTPVELGGVPSTDTWVQWAGTVQADAGNHSLAVRATDRSGYTQTGARVGVLPDGATGWHTIEFTAE
jgi:DMSO/TMAO reductase YedYZ molybdopterin-dependent catalytic subunit